MKRNTKVRVLSALCLALLLAAMMGAEAGEEYNTMKVDDASVASVITKLMKRLPSVWMMGLKAKGVAKKLPDYPGQVETPSSDLIYSWLEELCSSPHRRPGTPEGHKAEKWVAKKLKELGVKDVKLDPVPITVWTAPRWSLTVGGEKIPSFFVVNTGFTKKEGITAPLVYVGEGSPKDFEGVDVAGKIVVADVPFPYLPSGLLLKYFHSAYAVSDPTGSVGLRSGQYLNFVRENFTGNNTEQTAPDNDVYWQSYKRGAAAICLILRDQPSGSNTHYGPYDGVMKPLPALWIGKYEGERLRELAVGGAEGTFVLQGTAEPGVMHNVWGVLPGVSDEVILVTSHHDSPFVGASEDGAGTVQVLAQAWTWARVPRELRPRTMVFVVDAGHFYGSHGGHAFAREHKDIMDRTKILITLEHLGAKEVKEGPDGRSYVETGNPALTVMFTSHDPVVLGVVIKALKATRPKSTFPIPSDFFGESPTSDASGYVMEAGVPVISWIGCPYYLLDAGDTLDKIDRNDLGPIAGTVADMVKTYMAME